MSSGNGTPVRFAFSISQAQQSHLRQLHQEQHALGRGQRFIEALREIGRRLGRDPHVFGEQLFTLPGMKLDIRQAAVYPIVVDYGVHQEQKIVFIQGFKVLG